MKLEMVNKLYDRMKKLRLPIIVVIGNKLYATDALFSIIKEIDLDIEVPYIISTNMSIVKNCVENNVDGDFYIPFYYSTLLSKLGIVNSYMSNGVAVHRDNIREDPNFIGLNSYSAKDGVFMYRIEGYTMSLFKTILNLNKNDILQLDIYKSNTPMYLAKYKIIRTKKLSINLYLQYQRI